MKRIGFTIVELLVVITILLIVVASVVPRLRVVSKERKIREASRIVASAFERASRMARRDGSAALILDRDQLLRDELRAKAAGNPVPARRNRYVRQFPAGHRGLTGEQIQVAYGVTRMYVARHAEDFRGNGPGDDFVRMYSMSSDSNVPAGMGSFNRVVMNRPFGHNEAADRFVILPRDTLVVAGVEYEIQAVQEYVPGTAYPEYINGMLILTLNGNLTHGTSQADSIGDFTQFQYQRIERRPRLNNAFPIQLPAGHLIDLRYSGTFQADAVNPYAETFMSAFHTTDDRFVRIDFGPDGFVREVQVGNGIDTVSTGTPSPITETRGVFTNLYMMVSDDGLELDPARDQLTVGSNQWVVISPTTGRIDISPVVPQTNPVNTEDKAELRARMWGARGLARQAQLSNE